MNCDVYYFCRKVIILTMLKVFLDDVNACASIAEEVNRLLFTPPVFLCIGSDRVTGDSLGPVIGELLETVAPVYGNLTKPITALNLVASARQVRVNHPDRQIIAVDSAVGAPSDIGSIRVFAGGLKAGEAMGKNLPEVGDISITATVCAKNAKALSAVRLGLVYRLAQKIAAALKICCRSSACKGDSRLPYFLDSFL